MESFSLWSDEVFHLVWDQFTIVSDSSKLHQLLSSDIRSPSVCTQSRTWVTDYPIMCLPRQEGLRLYVGSNEYALLPIHWHWLDIFPGEMQHSSPHLIYWVLNLLGNRVLHSLWKNCTGIIRSIFPDAEVSLSITFFFSYWLSRIIKS